MMTVKDLCRAYLEPHDAVRVEDMNSNQILWEGSVQQAVFCMYASSEVESFCSITGGICINVNTEE